MTTGAQPPTSAGAADGPPAARPDGAGGRLPDFFIVGHQKSGTTALYEMLRAHPDVFMPVMKEPRYFASDLHSLARIGGEAPEGSRLPDTIEQYRALFADARPEQHVGEGSPQYLRSRVAAASIAELQPQARIIAILREPASFVRSLHQQWVHANQETETDLRRAVALEDERRAGRRIPRACHQPSELLYAQHVRYTEQLRRFEDAFGREQMLVLIYEDFRRDNVASVRRILDFLGLDGSIGVKALETKPLGAVRSMGLHRVTGALRRARNHPEQAGRLAPVLNALSALPARSEALKRVAGRVIYAEPERADEQLAAELKSRFRPEVETLSEYLGRDLVALWGYDRIT